MNIKRPLGVWIITIYYLLSVGWTTLLLVSFFSGVIPPSTGVAQRAYFESLSYLDWILIILLAILAIYSVILLFLLRKKSVSLFSVLLVADIGITIFEILRTSWLEASGGIFSLIGKIIGWIILFIIILYARNLAKKQILY